MRKLTFLLACLMMIGVGLVNAQSRTVSGKVFSAEDGEPIIGATVMVKGTTVGTITGVDGDFTVSVPANANTLIVSFIGMKTVEVEAKNGLTVRLESDAQSLDEVLVVAYGTSKKSSFTGSASSIKGDKISRGETSNLSKALEGVVAGVQIASPSGQPGESAAIRIRGLGSISANQSPLIVVDGVPYEGSLNSISSQDIETLNVLKDAAANSMYGARGSNGVILITTKRGEKGVTRVSFDSRLGVNSRAVSAYNVITNPGEYYEMAFEANRNNLVKGGMSYLEANNYTSEKLITEFLGYNVYKGVANNELIDPISGKLNPNASDRKWSDNWMTDPFRSGIKQEYNVSVSGGTDNTSAYLSASYLNDKGYVVNSNFSRLSTRVKVDQKINENMKIGANLSYSKTSTNSPIPRDGSSSYSNIFNFSQNIAPIYPIYKYDLATGAPINDKNGVQEYDFGSGNFENGNQSNVTRAYAGEQNPMYKLSYDSNNTFVDNLSSRVYAEIKFLKDFTFTANVAYDVFSGFLTEYVNPLQGDGKTYKGIGYKTIERTASLNANQLLTYNKKIGSHSFDVLLGHENKVTDVWYVTGSKMNFFDPFNPEFANAGSVSGLNSFTVDYKLEGYFSRLNYDYNDKYYFSASFRRDASSKFHPDVRWGNFWSVGGSWRVSEEDFLKGNDIINNLKVRSSYGTQGNDGISGSNLYLDQYTLISDGTNASPSLTYRGSPNLTWEKSNNFNVGIELGLFDRVTLDVDYFVKDTRDMIYQKPLPPSLGNPSWVWDNQIDMKNNGVEVELGVNIIKSRDLKWDFALNLTHYKNRLTKLPSDKDPSGYVAGNYWRKIGGSIYDWYTYEYAGVEAETGLSMWYMDDVKDVDGVEVTEKVKTTNYSDADRYETGKTSVPDLYGGISTNVTYKGFDLGIQTAFQIGGWVYDNVYASQMGNGTAGANWNKDIFKRWTPGNLNADVPRASIGDQNVNAFSTRFLTSASYFSLKNITFGYTLPKKMLSSLNVESVRLYATGDNLFMTSARQGLDPRQSFTGSISTGTYSALRTTSLGLTVVF